MRRVARREISASDSPSPAPSIHPRLARPFRSSSSRLASLIEPANLVKTIHYFTIMMAAGRASRAAPPAPSPSPRGRQLTISAQTNDLAS